jgi:hypothetical protein
LSVQKHPSQPEPHQSSGTETDRGSLDRSILHEFNNVVGSIMGNAEVADLELDPGHPAKIAIAEVIKSSRRARELLRLIKVRDPETGKPT